MRWNKNLKPFSYFIFHFFKYFYSPEKKHWQAINFPPFLLAVSLSVAHIDVSLQQHSVEYRICLSLISPYSNLHKLII